MAGIDDEFRSYKDEFSLNATIGEYNKGKLYTTIKGQPVKVALKKEYTPNKGATIIIGFFHGGECVHEIDLLEHIGLPGLFKRKRDARNAGADQVIMEEIINAE